MSIAALAVVACIGVIVWLRVGPRTTPAGQPALETLDTSNLSRLRDAFNDHADEPRVLVMLSPT